MPSIRRLFSSIRGHVRLRTIALVLIAGALAVVAAPPAWWSARGVTNQNPADDYASINQGQLKNLVKAAVQELDSTLPGGAGDTLHGMITRWATPTAQPDDYAAVNLGQIKAAAAPVYDRLKAIGYATAYPWASNGKPPDDYAMANIGQAKRLFAFDLTTDTNSVGIPDWWRIKYGGLQFSGPNSGLSLARGKMTYLQKYQLGLNPNIRDTDGDGSEDGAEVAAGTDPNNPLDSPRNRLPYGAMEVALSSSVIRAESSFGGGPSGRFREVTPQYYTGKGTEVITAEDPANPGVLTLIADDALTMDEKDEYLEKENLPDARPSTDREGAAWKTDWLPGVVPIPFYYYPVTGSEPTPPPKLRGSWSGFYHSLTEQIDAGVRVETGVQVHNDRLASLPPSPLPPLPVENVTRYAGAFTADGEYTFTDLAYGYLGTGVQTTSNKFHGNAWLPIDTASLDEAKRLLYGPPAQPGKINPFPSGQPYRATTSLDGEYGSRVALWIKTSDGNPAPADITHKYVKFITSPPSSGGTPPGPGHLIGSVDHPKRQDEFHGAVPGGPGGEGRVPHPGRAILRLE